ncbi:hypothetical protein [Cellulomonas sp. NS3]|uniref:hypothetical protein n=1 Tax=Cellulomonas sp. NS3 TaxID=2973977 RepID=UPI0021617EE5|nr:hypothetical protein [Cellulomonas sp. NS3]
MTAPDPDPYAKVRAELLELDRKHPEYGVKATLAGNLIGPASQDRPSVPPWRYLDKDSESGGNILPRAAAIELRYPVRFKNGGEDTASLSEMADMFRSTPEGIVAYYEIAVAAGAIEWDSDERCIRELQDPEAYVPRVFERWANRPDAKP